MSTGEHPNLGNLVSEAEYLRRRMLGAVQHDPGRPADDADVAAYRDLRAAAREVLGPDGVVGAPDAPAGTSRADLHHAAGHLEHALLERLAELRTGR